VKRMLVIRASIPTGRCFPPKIPPRTCTKITRMESISELQEVERECLRRFRAKAAEIKAQHPEMSQQIAFARAVTALPKTADKYQYDRQRLQWAGYPALPLR
jgi:hypothetical protein